MLKTLVTVETVVRAPLHFWWSNCCFKKNSKASFYLQMVGLDLSTNTSPPVYPHSNHVCAYMHRVVHTIIWMPSQCVDMCLSLLLGVQTFSLHQWVICLKRRRRADLLQTEGAPDWNKYPESFAATSDLFTSLWLETTDDDSWYFTFFNEVF